ncbi:MAG: GtrA family protein [Acidobacteriota bacterium]
MVALFLKTHRRWAVFNAVGLAGLLFQLAWLAALEHVGLHYLVAAVVAIELTILHNFWWHVHWTWADRPVSRAGLLRRLVRFHLTNGTVSLAGTVAVMAALVEVGHLDALAANVIAVAVCAIANFILSDRVVFAPVACAALLSLGAAAPARAADLHADAAAAFDRYARLTEARLDREMRGTLPFLWVDQLPDDRRGQAQATLRRGEIVTSRLQTRDGAGPAALHGAMCHHWVGTILIPGARLDDVVLLMQDYDRYQDVYRPAVRRSKTLSRHAGEFTVSLELFMKKVISVVLNTESDVRYIPVAPKRMQVRSVSTRIAEIADADAPGQREEPVGHGNGFLWRFNNYCALEERTEGTLVQCESISLSRDVPFGLGWLVGPFITDVPRESLEFTLGAMRKALASRVWSRSAEGL